MKKLLLWALCAGCATERYTNGPGTPTASIVLPDGVYPLSGDEFDLATDDLAPLSAMLDGVDIVGVGESTHASAGFHRARARVMKKLIVEDDFRLIALEGSWRRGRQTQEYLETCDPSGLVDAMEGLSFEGWMSPESAEFLQWVCSFNTANPDDPVAFISVDVDEPWYDVIALRERWPNSPVLSSLDRCIGANLTSDDDPLEDPLIASLYEERNVSLENDTVTCLDGIPVFREWLMTQPDHDDSLLALTSLAAGQLAISYFPEWSTAAQAAKDTGMADMLLAQRERQRAGARTLFWAHNFRTMTQSPGVTRPPDPSLWSSTGTQLEQRLDGRYAAIGFSGHTVTWAYDLTDETLTVDSDIGSVESRLRHYDESLLLVDTVAASSDEGVFGRWERIEYGNPSTFSIIPARHYRALVYVEDSPPMELWEGLP